MKDKILDFIEDHRGLVIGGAIVLVLIIVMFAIRSHNLKNKENDELANQPTVEATTQPTLEQDVEPTKQPENAYQSSLGLDKDKDKLDRVEVTETPTEPPTPPVQTEPNFEADFEIWGWTDVPKKNMDGSSCKAYLDKVSLEDFGTKWGYELTEEDFFSLKRYMVGVEQNPNGKLYGDLQSVGWLIQNLSNLNSNDAVRFTNLHVIGSLSDDHVALLCSYDWYSAHGLDDTLVVFEDISNTLEVKDFKDGDIFSATVFAHNIKVMDDVKGQRVVVVQYAVFE